MSPKLPSISGRKAIDAFATIGYKVVRQKGSHVTLQKGKYKTVVPLHYELSKGTLIGILKQCDLSKEDLVELCNKLK